MGGGIIKNFVEFFLSHSAEEHRRASIYGGNNFGYRKILCLRRLCHDFCRIFLSHINKKFRSGTFCSSLFLGYRKSLDERVVGGGEC